MENKKEDKYLEPVKEGIFTKIANFFKSIFSKKKNNDTEIPVVKENVPVHVTTNVETENETQTIKQEEFNKEEHIEISESEPVDIKAKIAEIQKRYETEGYDLTLLTNEEYEELKLLYQEQISTLNRRYENRVRELKTVRTKIQKMEAKA
ncbi:MAG: hypothetical protein IJX99_01580 [Clostridia bacterium]|nr:hypothetical protein [Clostridia bacterium]